MISKCDGDEQCLFDAKAIGILEVGELTKHNHRYYKFLDEALKPGINIPSNEKENSNCDFNIYIFFFF